MQLKLNGTGNYSRHFVKKVENYIEVIDYLSEILTLIAFRRKFKSGCGS